MNGQLPITKLLDEQQWQQLQDEARIANELQRQGMTRTDALKAAKAAIESERKQGPHASLR